MNAPDTLPVQTGVVNGEPVIAQVNASTLAKLVSVTLTADYERDAGPGYPVPDAGCAGPSLYAFPQTIPAGNRLELYSDEAAALVVAGAATYD